MADFRKCVFAFAVLALLLGSVGAANAQTVPFLCAGNQTLPPTIRAEGITELAGDIVISCTGGTSIANVTPGQPFPSTTILPTVNIRIFFNANVTSRLIGDWSEALLTIGEPPPAGPYVTCLNGNQSVGTVCNVYQGRVVGTNSVEFLSVPVLPPGTNPTTTYRVTNVRVNASMVAPGGSGTPGQVIGLVSATPAQTGSSGGQVISPSFPITNPQQVAGFVLPGLLFSVRNAANSGSLGTLAFQQCISRNTAGTSAIAVLRYTEGFTTAFKTRTNAVSNPDAAVPPVPQDTLGFTYNTETGYYNPTGFAGTAIATAGLADNSTRVRALFTGVPNGVSLFVTVREIPNTNGHTARLTASAAGSFAAVSAASSTYGLIGTPGASYAAAPVAIVAGTGEAVWEVTSSQPAGATGQLDFGLFATFTADPANDIPAATAQSLVSGSFAPIAGPATASSTAPIPRFVETGTPMNLFRVNVCVANLLFPFVTNQGGFDTGLAIANTSQDPWATGTQAGTCTLNWYGANAPAANPTPSVPAGTVWVNTTMNLAPNFQGYMIAQCRFQYAHGFAFISDVGARNLAMGYLALVIPDAVRTPSPFPLAGAGSGEQLGN